MEFCLNCGKPLRLEKSIAKCNCGFVKKSKEISTSEKIQKPIKKGQGILNEKNQQQKKGFPHKCKKCNHDFAEIIDLGASYSDESNIYLFKCNKCNFVEREGYGSGNS